MNWSPKVDEGIRVALAAKLESEEATVERQRGFDVADLQRDVVETYRACLPLLQPSNPPQSPWV
jgi:hypothetical protein